MPNPWLPLAGGPGLTTGQFLIGIVVVLGALLAVATGRAMASGRGLPTELERIRDQAKGSKADQTPASTRIDVEAVRNGEVDVADRIGWLFVEGSDAPERTADAVGEARSAIRAAWREKTSDVPTQALALAEWAVLVTVFGAVAVSTGVLLHYLEAQPTYPTLSGAVEEGVQTAHHTLDVLITVLASFPYLHYIWSLGFAYGFMLVEFLYFHWYLLAAVLLVASLGIGVLERRAGSVPRKPVFRRRTTGGFALGTVGFVWLTGSLVSIVGRRLGPHHYADLAGLGVAFLVLLAASGYGGYRLASRIHAYRREVGAPDRQALAVIVLRSVGRFLRGTAILFVAIYLLVAVLSGRLHHVLAALAGAALEVQLLVGLGVLAVVGLLAYEVRAAWPDVREAARELAIRKRVRAQTFAVGVPALAVGATYAIAWAFQLPLWVAMLAAVLAGVGFRLLTLALTKAKYRRSMRGGDSPPGGSILVQAYELDTDAGTFPLVTVGSGHKVAHRRVDEVAADAARAVEAKAHGEDIPPTVTSHFAGHLLEYGISDIDETRQKLRERVRKRVLARLREADGKKVYRPEVMEDDLAEFPEEIVEARLTEMAPWVRDTGRYLELVTDIWAQEERPQQPTAEFTV